MHFVCAGSRAKCLEIEQKLKEEQTEKDKYKRIIGKAKQVIHVGLSTTYFRSRCGFAHNEMIAFHSYSDIRISLRHVYYFYSNIGMCDICTGSYRTCRAYMYVHIREYSWYFEPR